MTTRTKLALALLRAHGFAVERMAEIRPRGGAFLFVFMTDGQLWTLPVRPAQYLEQLAPYSGEAIAYLAHRKPYEQPDVPSNTAEYHQARRIALKVCTVP